MEAIDKFVDNTRLSSRAMLVKLTVGKWQPYAFSDKATKEVELSNGVQRAGRFNKRLLKNSDLFERAVAAYNTVYLYHIKHTVPWLDDGMRILPSPMYFEYSAEIRGLMYEADRAADALASAWWSEVTADMQRLGPLGDPSDYPTNIREKFYTKMRFLPVPEVGDFRVDIDPNDKSSLEDAIDEVKMIVVKHLMGELMEPVAKLAERCAEFQGERGERWHHSLVENVQEVIDRLPKLNVMDDPDVAVMIDTVKQIITPYAAIPETLKDDQLSRDTARAQLDAAMDAMRVFMQGA